ncbi:unnamed protein product [Peronospora belbahrii]|uniref:Protein kinase domain-containing protein n=1 Tax=Peronospora belbahrii TaxID=622444 RepID=A0AAU9L447_9STRA|nr:unnamed protein product [Peronospora belbahrii]
MFRVKPRPNDGVQRPNDFRFGNFISDNMSPWVARLNKACISFGVDVVEGDAFLGGRGAYGRVFKLHKIGLVHDDPRVQNVIVIEKNNVFERLWIDLVEVMEAEPVLKQVDAEVLTRSILRVSQSDLLHSTLNQSIDNYGRSATQENINHLADQVYQNLA